MAIYPPAPPNGINLWATELRPEYLPQVCAMSGRPSDRWHKFTFQTLPGWIYALIPLAFLGLIGWIAIAIVRYSVTRRAKGVLPLHHSQRALLLGLRWGTVGAMLLGLLVAIASFIANNGWLLLLGLLVFLVAILFAAFGLRWFGPRAKVVEIPGYPMYLLELRNVHPEFVEALKQIQAGREVAYYPQPQLYYSGPR